MRLLEEKRPGLIESLVFACVGALTGAATANRTHAALLKVAQAKELTAQSRPQRGNT